MARILGTDEIEALYERLAELIDRAGPAKETVILSKLVLLLAEDIGDADRIGELVEEAARDLDPA